MEKYDDSVEIDSNDVHFTNGDTSDVESNDDEDDSYSISSRYQSLDDVDDVDNDDDDDLVEVDAVIGDRLRSINSITYDEIRDREFFTINKAYELY